MIYYQYIRPPICYNMLDRHGLNGRLGCVKGVKGGVLAGLRRR